MFAKRWNAHNRKPVTLECVQMSLGEHLDVQMARDNCTCVHSEQWAREVVPTQGLAQVELKLLRLFDDDDDDSIFHSILAHHSPCPTTSINFSNIFFFLFFLEMSKIKIHFVV